MKNKKDKMGFCAVIGGVIGLIVGASTGPLGMLFIGICGASFGALFASVFLK